ncbi:MAG: DNA topology modulation protein [Clostridia bacterium]|nr:DNA topology modulation protein [Clostridia bacterium]
MKIAILGHSGSGKSTLARKLGEHYKIEVLHLDTVQWMPNWTERPLEEKKTIVENFMNTHDEWVIDGNYSNLYQERRLEEADMIVEMLFGRFASFFRVLRRYKQYKGKTRPDMGEGCNEKVDAEFVKWIFFDGRSKSKLAHFKDVDEKYSHKTRIIKNQKELDKFCREMRL